MYIVFILYTSHAKKHPTPTPNPQPATNPQGSSPTRWKPPTQSRQVGSPTNLGSGGTSDGCPQRTASQPVGQADRPGRAHSQKITPWRLVAAGLLLISQASISLTVWAVLLGLLSHKTISKQAVFERLD